MENQKSKPAVFLDRDGVIFVNMRGEKPLFINKPEDVCYIDNSFAGLKAMQEKGYGLYIVSNQGGVGLGIMKKETLDAINNKMLEDLAKESIKISGVYCCIHKPKFECKCRKPNIGMVLQAEREHNLCLGGSYMIGDMTSDIEMGNRAGLRSILVLTGVAGTDNKYPDATPMFRAKDLVEAARYMEKIV